MAMHTFFPLEEMKLFAHIAPIKKSEILCVDKIASRPGGILGVDKIVHFTVFSILY